jgi:hypothetical protein
MWKEGVVWDHMYCSGQSYPGSQTTCPIEARPIKTRSIQTRPTPTHPTTTLPTDSSPHGQFAPCCPMDSSPHGQFAPWTTRPMDN